jgi:hypothetical protein
MDITIAFMTNFTLDIPDIRKQQNTLESFYKIFKINKLIKTYVFYDIKPLYEIKSEIKLYNSEIHNDYKIPGNKYLENLKNIKHLKDAEFINTKSLCDGYIQAINMCQTPYLFFLEHDWIFNENINHTLDELIKLMNENNQINCILFNKLKNKVTPFQQFYKSMKFEIPLLLTNRQSNNPNLIRVSHAKNIRIKLLNNNGCSCHPGIEFYYNINNMKIPNYCGGIECELCNYCKQDENIVNELGTYIYGPLNYNETIYHSDGCNRILLENFR